MQVAELAYVGAFQEMIHQIVERNPLQRKALTPYLASRDEVYRRQASDFAKRLEQYLSSIDLGLDYAVAAYLELCQDVLIETISFGRTGAYSCRCQRDAYRDVYTNAAAMRSYMVGLAVSQFLWRNHYEMYSFFKSTTEKRCRQVTRYLEIGPGHGMYLAAAAQTFRTARCHAVDISPTSLKLCREFMPFWLDDRDGRITLEQRDVDTMPIQNLYDFITIGEVIEHLDDPRSILEKLAALLADDGLVFLTTCANCPAKDHVYLFRTADEIRNLIGRSGLEIESELVLSLDDRSPKDAKGLINYAAVAKRKTTND